MKTAIFLKSFTAVVLMIFATGLIFGSVHDPKGTNSLKQFMTKNVPYPEFAKENNQTGFVVIAFTVENDGKIIIKNINGSTPEFKEYVENKLKELKLDDPQLYQDKTQYYRFDFQLINDY